MQDQFNAAVIAEARANGYWQKHLAGVDHADVSVDEAREYLRLARLACRASRLAIEAGADAAALNAALNA